MNGEAFAKGMSVGIEAIAAWASILVTLQERQAARAAEGRELSQEEVAALLNEGDVKVAAAVARING